MQYLISDAQDLVYTEKKKRKRKKRNECYTNIRSCIKGEGKKYIYIYMQYLIFGNFDDSMMVVVFIWIPTRRRRIYQKKKKKKERKKTFNISEFETRYDTRRAMLRLINHSYYVFFEFKKKHILCMQYYFSSFLLFFFTHIYILDMTCNSLLYIYNTRNN